MTEKKDVCVLKLNTLFEPEELYGSNVIREIEIPEGKLPITVGFNQANIIGVASNFSKKKDGIYCDLEYKERPEEKYTNAYTAVYYDDGTENKGFKNCRVDGVSMGFAPHAQIALRNNLVEE